MSLVDYASSSDDDVSEDKEREEESEATAKPQNEPQVRNSSPTIPPTNQRSSKSFSSPHLSPSCIETLPDASLLLNSPSVSLLTATGTGTDHASRVAAAMAESASRKRDSHGLPSSLPRSKVPKGTLPHTKMVPDTVGGILVPPQLSGRSNIVTEDIGKLFVKRQAEPSSH
ncbi:hypothetical protein P3X46_000648 [Hevea brasiliensis]|uniref:Uncharacterized protein n=1 Tax=Hevea brasiliensis TaxID=3981 RepID=A0ABQ9NDN5_HEVBR|nr:uncharacterized protein LOC110655076 [Hevea brasiliensis]KAJ9189340.1 hypothetical protein P3X46_000648 [Hevea brasiliensis]